MHTRQLRPNLYNPACKKELDDLVIAEKKRSEEHVQKIE
jgi:hypothetical protein